MVALVPENPLWLVDWPAAAAAVVVDPDHFSDDGLSWIHWVKMFRKREMSEFFILSPFYTLGSECINEKEPFSSNISTLCQISKFTQGWHPRIHS